ncbi:MAG: hypothetical protein R6X34_30095 [Chloroflexota bacterium]|jgi:hypothetical protein
MEHQDHQMELTKTFPTGAEEWHCLDCERRFVMQWTPYKKVVLDSGDEQAIHVGSKNGLHMQNSVPDEDTDDMSDELRDALNDFLSDIDFGD